MGARSVPGPRRSATRGVKHRRHRNGSGLFALAILLCFMASGLADVTHTVVKGERLADIARRYGSTTKAIADANHLKNPNLVIAGTQLTIPGGALPPVKPASRPSPPGVSPFPNAGSSLTHIVAAGESVAKIAQKYGVASKAIVALNSLKRSSLIKIGQLLHIPAPPVPRVETLLVRYSAQFGVDQRLVKAISWEESGWKQGVVSGAGAIGIMQVLPETARFTNSYLLDGPDADIHDAEQNIRCGVRFLAFLLAKTGGDQPTAVAGYFQGLRSVRAIGVRPATKAYVDDVMALKARF